MIRVLFFFVFFASAAATHEDTYSATIERWYDGDTPTVTIDLGLNYRLSAQSLRLWCIDTPEVRGENKADGLAVRDYVRGILPKGTEVTVQILGKGKFGRYLVILTPLGQATSLNRHLLDTNRAQIEAYSERDRAACEAMQ